MSAIQHESGMTILHKLAKTSNLHCERMMSTMFMPFLMCNHHSNKERIQQWIETRDKFGRTALHLACYNGLDVLVHYLLQLCINVDRRREMISMRYEGDGKTALHLAVVGRGNREDRKMCMKYLLDVVNMDLLDEVDNEGKTALGYALESTQPTLCHYLLKAQDAKSK